MAALFWTMGRGLLPGVMGVARPDGVFLLVVGRDFGGEAEDSSLLLSLFYGVV